jgi:Kef-type K+ transport system membrane component KefB
MKTLIITLLFLGLTISSYSSQVKTEVMKEGIMKVQDLPAVVIKSVGDDFSVYLPT